MVFSSSFLVTAVGIVVTLVEGGWSIECENGPGGRPSCASDDEESSMLTVHPIRQKDGTNSALEHQVVLSRSRRLSNDQSKVILGPSDIAHLQRPERWHGVNYGNRFLPEDWIEYPYDFFKNITDRGGPRAALWDLPPNQASKDLMLKWLDETIQEVHFQQMQQMGVEVLRVPVGYWNFVSYPNDEGPAVPDAYQHFKERLKNLHRIATPEEYKPYFDKIFTFAQSYGVKVLLDLHGLPGSQNGEIHSGACMRDSDGQNVDFFQMEGNTENREMALKAVRAMAKYGKDKEALWGIQVINEPHLHNDQEHDFLKSYFQDACKAIREEGVVMEKPCMVFTWTFDMPKWVTNEEIFPKATYGRVIFDTHLYHFESDGEHWSLQQAKDSYKSDLEFMRRFSLQSGMELVVGEYTLAGNSFTGEERRSFAEWLVNEFDFSAMGSFFWTFDCKFDTWSLVKMDPSVNWKELWRADRDDCIPYNMIYLLGGDHGYLSARDDGHVTMSPNRDFWESWLTCYKTTAGQLSGAVEMSFRSIAHGNFLSVSTSKEVSLSSIRQGWESFQVLSFLPSDPDSEGDGYQPCQVQSFHQSWLSFAPAAVDATTATTAPLWDAIKK